MSVWKLLTPEEVAKILSVSPNTLSNWRVMRKGPPHTKIEGGVRYYEDSLKKYIKKQAAKAVDNIPQPVL